MIARLIFIVVRHVFLVGTSKLRFSWICYTMFNPSLNFSSIKKVALPFLCYASSVTIITVAVIIVQYFDNFTSITHGILLIVRL